MAHDALGHPITGADDAAIGVIDDFVMGVLAYETRAANILTLAEAAPDLPLAQVYAGCLWMFLESPDAPARAAAFIAAAERLEPLMTTRERLSLAMLKAWAHDDPLAAIALAEQAGREHPRDLVAMKFGQYHAFNRGDAPAMLRLALAVRPATRDVAYAHGMAAFAFEQCHLLDDAEAAAREALALTDREPWAQHALAHVMLTQGRIGEGAQFLEDASVRWTGLNSFMSTHNWWHLALFYLSQGRIDDVLALYDRAVWGQDKSYTQDQIGAIALLARVELAGGDVGDRWADVADHVARRRTDTVQPFLTMHYVYGLARADRPETDDLLAAVRARAAAGSPHARRAWAEVALPACRGLAAAARGRPSEAADRLGEALPRMAEIGGSHAQRDLFEQIHLDCLIRAGRLVAAQQALERRRQHDPVGVPLNRQLAEVYDRLGLPAQAAQARARAA